MCSPEKQNARHCSPSIYLTIGGTLIASISMVTYMYVKVGIGDGHSDASGHVFANGLSRQGSDLFLGVGPPTKSKRTCKDNPCGTDAICDEGNCACPPQYTGDPTDKCEKLECLGDDDCEDKQACSSDYECVNPCQPENTCGLNATCKVFRHTALCFCRAGFDGNPYKECKVAGHKKTVSRTPCEPSPCGPNSICRTLLNTAVCSCQPLYKSSPPNCRHECESDNDCGSQHACRKYRCVSPCIDCGENAHCSTSDHLADCKCPTGYTGDPLVKCIPECQANSDCPNERHACFKHACVDPCMDNNTCGVDAHCSVIQRIPICTCPANMSGNPFEYCWSLDAPGGKDVEDVFCDPNPCGTNATCSLAADGDRYYCNCSSGFFGNPYKHCQLAECEQDSDCEEDKECTENECVDPCRSNPCGVNAVCTSRSHLAICTCISGTIGNPFKGCSCSSDYLCAIMNLLGR